MRLRNITRCQITSWVLNDSLATQYVNVKAKLPAKYCWMANNKRGNTRTSNYGKTMNVSKVWPISWDVTYPMLYQEHQRIQTGDGQGRNHLSGAWIFRKPCVSHHALRSITLSLTRKIGVLGTHTYTQNKAL